MCASYNPPSEYITDFNTSLFNQDTGGSGGGLTKTEADTYYLSKLNSDTSIGAITTFQSVNVNTTLSSNSITGITTTGVKSIYTDTTGGSVRVSSANGTLYLDSNSTYCAGSIYSDTFQLRTTTGTKSVFGNGTSGNLGYGSASMYNFFYGLNNTFVSGATTDTLSLYTTTGTKNIFTNGIATSVLNIGSSLGTNTINGTTTFPQNLYVSGTMISNTFSFQTATGIKNLFANATTAAINFAVSTSTTSFFGVSTFNQEVIIPTRLTLKGVQYANEVQNVSGTSATLTFPLQQIIMLSSAGSTNINITLPTITASSQVGVQFTFTKTGSVTNSVIFTAGGTNQFLPYGSITNTTPFTGMINTDISIYLVIIEVTTGVFAWRSI